MSIFSKWFGKKQAEEETPRVGGMEDFMTLIRVYYQAVMATNIGISNINFLPDMAVFKRTLKVPTQNNKLGIAEKSKCKKMLIEIYGLPDGFFKEIDASIKKNVKNINDVKTYLFMFQGFSQGLDDAHRQLDAMEVPSSGYIQEAPPWHDREDRTRHPHQAKLEGRKRTQDMCGYPQVPARFGLFRALDQRVCV